MNPETSIELIGEELAEKDKDCMIFLTCGIKKTKNPKLLRKEIRLVVTRGRRQGDRNWNWRKVVKGRNFQL